MHYELRNALRTTNTTISKHYEKWTIPWEKLQTKLTAASQCPITFIKLSSRQILLQFAKELDGQNLSLKSDKHVLINSARHNAILIFALFIVQLMSFQRRKPSLRSYSKCEKSRVYLINRNYRKG